MSGEDSTAERLAYAVAVVAVASIASLAVFFAVGGPFGTFNDVGNGLIGILSAALAMALWRRAGSRPSAAAAVGAAIVGAGIAVVGSGLVVSGTTGFFLAGLVSSVGFALIGLWLIVVNRTVATDDRWSRRLTALGTVAGVLMAFGFAAAPGIAQGIDDAATAPGWAWIASVGWIGVYVLYPAWAVSLARALAARVATEPQAA